MKLHPFTVVILFLCSISIVLINDNPVLSIGYLLYICLFLGRQTGYKRLKKKLMFALLPAISVIIINPILSQEGRNVLYRGMKLPIMGRFVITLEGIGYGIHMSIKLIAIYMIFMLVNEISEKDDMFSFFSKYAYKFTLVVSMSLNVAHRLALEVKRVKEVMMMRGVEFQSKSIIKRIKFYYPLFKVVLISALEGSIERAEALYSKGYGKNKPTRYKALQFSALDGIMVFYIGVLFALTLWGNQRGIIAFKFYPTMTEITVEALKFTGLIGLLLISNLLIIWRRDKWKLLQYKI